MRRIISGLALALLAAGCAEKAPDAGAPAGSGTNAPAAAPAPTVAAAEPVTEFEGRLVRFTPAQGLFSSIEEVPSADCPAPASSEPSGTVSLTRETGRGLRIVKRSGDFDTIAASAGFTKSGPVWVVPGETRKPADRLRGGNWDGLYGEWPGAGGSATVEPRLVAVFPRPDGCSVVFLVTGGNPLDQSLLRMTLSSVVLRP
jgi:hypothetical protein